MTKISTLVILEVGENLGEFHEVKKVSYDYSGPVALAKKGRDQLQKNMKSRPRQQSRK